MNFKIIFELDGTGICYDPTEPLHLDSLLAWALLPMQYPNRKKLTRTNIPEEIQLPLLEKNVLGHEIWCASALFPEEAIETITYIRKRLRHNKLYYTEGAFDTKGGPYRMHNIPLIKTLCRRMVAYASGNRKEVKRILKKHIKLLGKKRQGIVKDIHCEEIAENWSMVKEGKAMRWLPNENGPRMVRLRPPYWNNTDRVLVAEIGADYQL